ncbi:hypothetical protein [Gluconobacter albidus]|mgnify:FL=1|uniref:Phage tail protein n=1 Tax=Gluconobacter albidus TaxID=318683 RepID=A0AAW3QZU0_9PROT|nr:hypothetical protein [Gluconobacter albidus]KXV41879.1 hypothetical protein AD941_02345 [Gluconobacter albidus]MBS1029690.1 hypothetical protein [Gluconobacter albidus]GBQ91362.1 hypothetical protein AA3250_2250 [Gluconobacter albidus NBRC 3250]GLQ68458.1 hypothetical protein GCM10007866_09060 [Gluconobacter albidus]
MPKLSDLKIDSASINDGVWVDIEQFPGLRIRTRGYTDAFVDAQNRRLAVAAEKFRNDPSRIPNAVRRAINAGLLADFLILDVDGLYADDAETQKVSVEDFGKLIADPEYARLMRCCWEAASLVANGAVEQAEAASGN